MTFKKLKKGSTFSDTIGNKKNKIAELQTGYFKVSFQYLDTSQKYGSAFKDWQKDGLLSKALETIAGYCCGNLISQIDGTKFCKYGDFPPADKTRFRKPEMIPEDACWARIHVTGPAVLAGHIVKDTFYVVFLDKFHSFYLTRRVTGR